MDVNHLSSSFFPSFDRRADCVVVVVVVVVFKRGVHAHARLLTFNDMHVLASQVGTVGLSSLVLLPAIVSEHATFFAQRSIPV